MHNLFPLPASFDNQIQSETEAYADQEALSPSDSAFMIEPSFLAVGETILQTLGGTEAWNRLSLEDKLLQFASFLSNMRKDLRLGGLVGVYLMLKNNLQLIGEEIKRVIVEELFTTLSEYET